MKKRQGLRPSLFRRYLWHFNRLPTGRLLKVGLRALHYREIRERRAMAGNFPPDPKLDALAAALNRDGYALVAEAVDPQLLADLSQASEAKLQRALEGPVGQISTHKNFWVRLLDEDMVDGRLPTDSPFVRFALQPSVIAILTKALGEIPRLDYVLLTSSQSSDRPLSYSQLWHRDHDDTRTIKLFVYLTDVKDDADGPFTFLPGPVSDRFGPSFKSHRPDEAIFVSIRPGEKKEMIAPRLTTFLVETSRCLHMGSRVKPGHTRLLYTASYITAPRMFPESPSPFQVVGEPDALLRKLLNIR